jgi:hypothetical protein
MENIKLIKVFVDGKYSANFKITRKTMIGKMKNVLFENYKNFQEIQLFFNKNTFMKDINTSECDNIDFENLYEKIEDGKIFLTSSNILKFNNGICDAIKGDGNKCNYKIKNNGKCGIHIKNNAIIIKEFDISESDNTNFENAYEKIEDNKGICDAIKGDGYKCTYKIKNNGKCGIHKNNKNDKFNHLGVNVIYTIGHSNHNIEHFIKMLKVYNITNLIDVRSIPKSRKNPHFASIALKLLLKNEGIKYTYIEKLGGFRKPSKISINLGWKNLSFRNYADHMQTREFSQGLEQLEEIAKNEKVAYMCSEAVPWRCHRSLISDALKNKGWNVCNIMNCNSETCHKYTSFLKIEDEKLTYPAYK